MISRWDLKLVPPKMKQVFYPRSVTERLMGGIRTSYRPNASHSTASQAHSSQDERGVTSASNRKARPDETLYSLSHSLLARLALVYSKKSNASYVPSAQEYEAPHFTNIFSLLSLFWKSKSRLTLSPCRLCCPFAYQLLNDSTNLTKLELSHWRTL
jgi:hypothetical protein